MDLERCRELFPIVQKFTYLNHAATGPAATPVTEAIERALRLWLEDENPYEKWEEDLAEARGLFARLIGAHEEEIAPTLNTSMGLSTVAGMIRYEAGDNIVTNDMEFPVNVYPWLNQRRKGVEVRFAKNVGGKVLPAEVERMVDDRTRVVAVSHVQYINGFRSDLGLLADLAHRHGAYLCVDAIQSVGVLQVDVKRNGVDFLCSGGYKWLLSPEGIAFLYVDERLVREFEPECVGWRSVKKPDLFDSSKFLLSDTASRFETGTPNFLGYVGAKAAMRLLIEVGLDRIESRVLKLNDHLITRLQDMGLELQTPTGRECRSGIVNFKVDDPKETLAGLRRENIIVSVRGGGIRVSPHFYNTVEEIDRLLDLVKRG
jgi:cysteine desulfurase/selenocysteine lyase